MRQLPLPLGPQAEADFDSFLVGRNEAALAHLRTLVMPGPPVYLWGPAGSGKSHLLSAAVHSVRQTGRRAASFGAGAPAPWALGADWTLAVIDDCDRLDTERQRAAFMLFVEAAAHQVQILAAGRLPPIDLPLREDLRTRLGWGPVFALQPLTDDEVRAALQREARRRGLVLNDELAGYLLTRCARDLSHLMALLDRLDAFALAQRRALTVPLLRQMLSEEEAQRCG